MEQICISIEIPGTSEITELADWLLNAKDWELIAAYFHPDFHHSAPVIEELERRGLLTIVRELEAAISQGTDLPPFRQHFFRLVNSRRERSQADGTTSLWKPAPK